MARSLHFRQKEAQAGLYFCSLVTLTFETKVWFSLRERFDRSSPYPEPKNLESDRL